MLQPETLHKNPCSTNTSAKPHPAFSGAEISPFVPAGKDGIWRQEMTTKEEPNPNKIHHWASPELKHFHLSLLLLIASLNSP